MKIEPYRALVHMGTIGIAFAAVIYFLQYIKQPMMYYTLFGLTIVGFLVLIYYLVFKPIVDSEYFNF